MQKGQGVVVTDTNDTISFRNEEGFLMGRIGNLDLGGIISCEGHRIKFVWNGSLQRMYVWMDGIELGYLNMVK